MKFHLIYTSFAVALGAFLLLGNSSGPGFVQNADRTGSPLAGGIFCSTCHSGGNFAPSIAVQVMDDTVAVNSYEPGKTYTLRVAITAGNGTPARYGFQAVALTGATNLNAGDFGTPPAGMRISTVNNRKYAEHNTPSVSNTFEVEWTAPAAGSGDVRFYSAGLANNNNSNTTGDNAVRLTSPLTLTEMAPSSTSDLTLFEAFSAWPNPVNSALNIRIAAENSAVYRMQVLDVKGNLLRTEQVQLTAGENNLNRNWSDLASGVYVVQFSNAEGTTALRVVKQ